MKLHDLDPAFLRRLENWGAYWGASDYRPSTSPTHEVCRLLAIQAGQQIEDPWAESNARPETDAEDAMVMERHWAMCAYRVTAQDRALIKAHWVSRADPRMVCRLLKLRYLSWEGALCEAVERFQRAVELLEGCKDAEHA